MALLQLYNTTTPSLNPSGLTNVLPGGAGVQVAGSTPVPGISSPRVEQYQREVLDYTAPTQLSGVTGATTASTPAPAGKLLVLDAVNGAFGSRWKLNNAVKQAIPANAYGIVVAAGNAQEAGAAVGSANGNVASNGTKAQVAIWGPVQASVQGTVGGAAISAGMPLAADGAGNLTYAGASPAAGTVLGIYADSTMLSTVSIPQLKNVYLGGY